MSLYPCSLFLCLSIPSVFYSLSTTPSIESGLFHSCCSAALCSQVNKCPCCGFTGWYNAVIKYPWGVTGTDRERNRETDQTPTTKAAKITTGVKKSLMSLSDLQPSVISKIQDREMLLFLCQPHSLSQAGLDCLDNIMKAMHNKCVTMVTLLQMYKNLHKPT